MQILTGNPLHQFGQLIFLALCRLDDEVKAVIDDALHFAEQSPWPDPATAASHVYHEK